MARKQIDRYLETMSQRRGFMECKGTQESLECDKEGSCHYGGGKGVKGGSTHSNAHQIDTLTMRNLPQTEEELSSQTEGLRQVRHHFRQLICFSHGTLCL